ncbi:unnamed protein product [Phytomonas sp. Hart1]|nr:unnamed protein product [Phytomonas sp. Hart1]|eukprot:CCW68722.1 unnamed protein product [Phytomonas sp. isolate Hart1]
MLRLSTLSHMAPSVIMLNKGHVVSWMSGRGFGFIEDMADKKQHFVHFSALQTEPGGYRALSVDQEVEYEVTFQDGRTRAENVTAPGGAKLPSGTRPPQGPGMGQGMSQGMGRGGGRGFARNDDNRGLRNNQRSGNGGNSGNFSDDF